MIVGQRLLDLNIVKGGSVKNLKHSTYDLTVGEIIPIGKKAILRRRKDPVVSPYYLEPREMVWVLSKEEFDMPANVTGLATLRTTYTKDGILALNVGIIDPLFRGPISTALINFSDRPRRIAVGDKFFRLAFFEHDDVSAFHRQDENMDRTTYIKNLEDVSYADFSPSFLNVPNFDDDYYTKKFWSIIFNGLTSSMWIFIPLVTFVVLMGWFVVERGFVGFLASKWVFIGEHFKTFKWW